jgi:hypothetical protein
MAETITFENVRPPERDDGIKYTGVDFKSSDTYDGTYTVFHHEDIPDYIDSGEPPEDEYIVEAAQLPGWYQLVFTDENGNTVTYSPVWYEGSINFRPTTREVAVHIKNRTVDIYNKWIGDFTDDTPVTRREVEELIDKAEEWVLRRLHIPLNPSLAGVIVPVVDPLDDTTKAAIRSMIALMAAALVELTKYSEQIARGVSPYPYLKELFDDQMDILYEDVTGKKPSGDGAGGTGLWDLVAAQSGNSYFDFPTPYQVNWDTRF